MTCELYEDVTCEHCQELYCPDEMESIHQEYEELQRAVDDAIMELKRFIEEYEDVL